MTLRTPLLLATCLLAATALPTTQPAPSGTPRPLSSWDAQVTPLLATMTLDEKIGQMTQPDQMFLEDVSDVETLFLGSLLSGGDSDPPTNTVEDWADMYDRLQSRALKTRLRIPLLYGVDAVHGHSNVIGAVIFPHNIGLGATRNAKLVEEIGRITALEVRATGINWTFAPSVAVPRDERWGRTYEGFSEQPAVVAELGGAAVRGLQGTNLADPLRVLACAKHYVGDGGTTWGTGTVGRPNPPGGHYPLDRGDTRLSEAELRALHMQGYLTALAANVGTIMPSYSSWNGVKASGSHRLLTEILKQELKFEGFLISDYNAIDELPGDYRAQVKASVLAGMDMFMIPQRYREFIRTLKGLVESGEVPMTRIDDAVRRILRVKFAMGLMEPQARLLADRSLLAQFGSAAHRAVGRQAVRESLVVLKNEHRRLPLARTLPRIHVAGRGANDIGMQTGGWTITWQGQHGPTTIGTTVLMALQQLAGPKQQITYSADGSGAKGAAVGVVVIGESPYAEFLGDSDNLSLAKEDVAAVRAVKAAGVPVVVVLLTGRPVILTDIVKDADAIVAAWLPGTEGLGVGDVLFGTYKPTGKLPFTWPRTMQQIPLNVGDATYDPLYAFGHGLTY